MTDGLAAGAGQGGEPDGGQLQAVRLENQQLQAEIAALKQQVDRLTVKVAHDLRGPLRHIGAFALVIEEDHGAGLGAEVSVHLQTIREAAAKMSLMLDELLQNK